MHLQYVCICFYVGAKAVRDYGFGCGEVGFVLWRQLAAGSAALWWRQQHNSCKAAAEKFEMYATVAKVSFSAQLLKCILHITKIWITDSLCITAD